MNRFCYDVYVPSIQSNVKFYELINSDYLSMLKFLQNNDDEGLSAFIEYLLIQLIVDKKHHHQFDRLDKYCILLTVIMISSGNVLEFTTTCAETKKQYNIEVVLGEIISAINDIKISGTEVNVDNNIKIKLSPPRSLRGPFNTPITSITIDSIEQDTTNFTTDQLDDLISVLPYNVFTDLQQTYKTIHDSCTGVDYFSYINPYQPEAQPIKYTFNLFDDSFYQFIKLVLKEDLLNYYKVMYTLTTKFKLDMSYIQSITPNETKTYLSLIKQDIKEIKESHQQNQQQQPPTQPVAPDPAG